MTMTLVGKSIPRKEGRRKVTGVMRGASGGKK